MNNQSNSNRNSNFFKSNKFSCNFPWIDPQNNLLKQKENRKITIRKAKNEDFIMQKRLIDSSSNKKFSDLEININNNELPHDFIQNYSQIVSN